MYIIQKLRNVESIIFIVNGLSFKKAYARIGKIKFDNPKNINLALHAELNLTKKYVHDI
jgi:hypothetical protein